MKKFSFASILAVALMAATFCSCNKVSDPFDHFEISYSLTTNEECRDCFDTTIEILCNDKVIDSDYFNSVQFDGSLKDSRLTPNSTITFRTVPKYSGTIPAKLDFMLKYEIDIKAIAESGAVTGSQHIKENGSFTEKLDLSTAEAQQRVLELFAINYKFQTKTVNGKVVIDLQ